MNGATIDAVDGMIMILSCWKSANYAAAAAAAAETEAAIICGACQRSSKSAP